MGEMLPTFKGKYARETATALTPITRHDGRTIDLIVNCKEASMLLIL
jgi:hypothetical protein